MDWSPIVAVAVGGVIGLSGEFIGRSSANRQANTLREQAADEARVEHSQRLTDELEREVRARGREAAERIIRAFADNPIPLKNAPGMEATHEVLRQRVLAILYILYVEIPCVPDASLRESLTDGRNILDWSLEPELPELDLRLAVRLVRHNVVPHLGAWLRREDIPPLTEYWTREAPRILAEHREKVNAVDEHAFET
jgi:hypothetical protein